MSQRLPLSACCSNPKPVIETSETFERLPLTGETRVEARAWWVCDRCQMDLGKATFTEPKLEVVK